MAKTTPETNPFVQSLVINALWKLESHAEAAIEEGSIRGRSYKSRLIDIDERCTVYTEHLLSWFKDLTTSAKDMFMYIAHKLPLDKDYCELTEDKYCEDMKVHRNTYHNAKSALVNRLLIPRHSRKNTYWINPQYLYKGDRLKAFRARAVERNEDPLKKFDEPGPELP